MCGPGPWGGFLMDKKGMEERSMPKNRDASRRSIRLKQKRIKRSCESRNAFSGKNQWMAAIRCL